MVDYSREVLRQMLEFFDGRDAGILNRWLLGYTYREIADEYQVTDALISYRLVRMRRVLSASCVREAVDGGEGLYKALCVSRISYDKVKRAKVVRLCEMSKALNV